MSQAYDPSAHESYKVRLRQYILDGVNNQRAPFQSIKLGEVKTIWIDIRPYTFLVEFHIGVRKEPKKHKYLSWFYIKRWMAIDE